MLITSKIREAADERQVQFLVNAYVEAVRYCDPLGLMPAAIRELPFRDIEDAATRIQAIGAMLEAKQFHGGQAQVVASEALNIMIAARHRLEALRLDRLSTAA